MGEVRIKRLPFFVIFLAVYCFVNLLGIIDFPFYRREYETQKLFEPFLLGLAGVFTGYIFSKVIPVSTKTKGTFKENRFNFLVISVNVLAVLIVFLTHLANGGIVILNDDTRFGSFFFVNVIVYAGVLLTLLYISKELLYNRPITFKLFLLIIFQCLVVLSLGYRSPVIILIGSSLIAFFTVRNSYQNKLKKIFSLKNVVVFGLLVYIMSSISAYRISQKYSIKDYYRNMDKIYLKQNPSINPFVPTLSLFRYNQYVIGVLIDETKYDHMNGGLFLSNFKALLPGSYPGARNIVGKIIGARKMPNGKHWSTTPTLQGALYVDGGNGFVFFGFFLISLIIGISGKVISKRPSPFNVSVYSFLFVSFLMTIHTGYFDLMFYLLLLGLFFFKFLIMRVKPIKIKGGDE